MSIVFSRRAFFFITLANAGLFVASAQTTVTLNPGADIQASINSLAAGSTILLNPGTYTPSATLNITQALTIQNNQQSPPVYINVPSSQPIAIQADASNITLAGFTISGPSFTGPNWGIYAGDGSSTPQQFSSIVLRNITFNGSNPASSNSNAIYVRNVLNAVVDGCTVNNAPLNGIYIDHGSTGALVINNNVNNNLTPVHQNDGIVVKDSNSALVAGNTVTGAGVDGIIFQGASFGRIERNVLNNPGVDGITISQDSGILSTGNYIGKNAATASHAVPGAGIWLNAESDGTLVYGNTITGFPENGFDVFLSSYNEFRGNVTSNDSQGGFFMCGVSPGCGSTGNIPANNIMDGNYVFGIGANSGFILQQSNTNTLFDNFILGNANSGGIRFQTTSGSQAYLNTFSNAPDSVYAFSDTQSSSFYLNRQHTAATNTAISPAGISFDGGPVLGGNFWFGNSSTNPYTVTGSYVDHYPYPNDTLGKQPTVALMSPSAGSNAAIGSRKTIEWLSSGCSYVDIDYTSGETGLVSIAANYPDVGHYNWVVPSVTLGSDYSIVLTCKNGSQTAIGNSESGPNFTVAKTGLELLSPQANLRITGGTTALVAWTKSASVGNVNVLYRAGPGSFTQTLVSNVSGDYVQVTVPAGDTSQGAFLVQEVATGGSADSTDGFVTVMDDNPRVFGPEGTLTVGTLQHVEWTSIPGSLYVNLDLLNPLNGMYIPLIQNLPDFGSFNFLVPATLGAGTSVRVSFLSSPSTLITQAGAEAPDLSPLNGSFETGSVSPWLEFGATTIAVSSLKAYGGVYSLAESGAAGELIRT